MNVEPITGRYTTVAGARIFFDEAGGQDARTIICIHPAGSDGRMFADVMCRLASAGYHVVAPDLPGHCRSFPVGWEPLSGVHDMAEFVAEFASELGAPRPVLLGTSMGGLIALDLLAGRPDEFSALVALEAASWTAPTFPSADAAARPSWAPSWSDALERAAVEAMSPTVGPELAARLRWLHRSTSQRAAAPALAGWSRFDLRGRLAGIGCPVLLVLGADDFWLPRELVELTAAEIGESCRVEVVEDLGHYPAVENPDLVARMAMAFLADHRLGPAAGA